MRNFREQCCDCGAIHRLDLRIVDGRVEFRTRRDDRATAAARRSFKLTPDERRPFVLAFVTSVRRSPAPA